MKTAEQTRIKTPAEPTTSNGDSVMPQNRKNQLSVANLNPHTSLNASAERVDRVVDVKFCAFGTGGRQFTEMNNDATRPRIGHAGIKWSS